MLLAAALVLLQAQADDEDVARPTDFREFRSPEHKQYKEARGRLTDHLKVSASLAAELWYDDNILLTTDDEESDVIAVGVPELALALDRDDLHAKLDYRGRERIFADHSEFDGMEHVVSADAGYTSPVFWVRAGGRFERLLDPYDLVIFGERAERRVAEGQAAGGWRFNRAFVELTGSARTFDVREDSLEAFDYDRRQAGVVAGLEVGGRTDLLIEASQSWTDYDENSLLNDFRVTYVYVGARLKRRSKFYVELHAGLFRVAVDESPGAIPTGDDTEWSVRATVDWFVSPRNSLTLEIERLPYETVNVGWSVVTRVRLGYAFWISERVTGGVLAYRGTSEYPDSSRDPAIYSTAVELKYEIGRTWVLKSWIEYRVVTSGDQLSNLHGYVSVGFEF